MAEQIEMDDVRDSGRDEQTELESKAGRMKKFRQE